MNTPQEITLTNNNWKLILDLNGGRIKEVSFNDKQILGTFQRIDGKPGNTHLCVPNFGAEGADLGLPFHGPARGLMWTKKNQTENSVDIYCETSPCENYPASLLIEQKFLLNGQFKHEIAITNKGSVEVPVNLGIHYYWATPSGWEGTTVNGQDVTKEIKGNGNISLGKKNDIWFPNQTQLKFSAHGFNKAVLWTAFLKEENKTTYDNSFCCIEPVCDLNDFFGAKSSMLKPRGSKIFSIHLLSAPY